MKTTYACIALFAGSAHAACPNGCSDHGVCGEHDSCTCHSNWFGADCSQRQCMSYKSWITTGQGDLNYDGDREDATVYQADTEFTSTSLPYLVTQTSPGGDWEYWPSKFSATGEAHFYMECSNRGLCNRETGECECFAGYTGEACRRTTCPDDCNGHGLCLTVGQQGADASYAYDLWDHDMSRSCVCDPGFSGPSCANIDCPTGDDPLTTDQQHETQWIDLYANTGEDFDGSITLTYVDHFGHSRTTGTAAVLPYAGSNTNTAANIQAALRALPNSVLSDVVVSEGYCDKVIPGTGKFASDVFSAGTNNGMTYTIADDTGFRCGGVNTGNYYLDTGTLYTVDGVAATGLTDEDDVTCFELTAKHCNRIKITFGTEGSTGDVASLVVNTDGVTLVSTDESDANELDNFQMSATAVETLEIAVADATGGVTASYTAPTTKSCGAGSCSVTSSTKVIALDADGGNYGTSTSERIRVYCGTGKILGTFTVASVATNDITVTEYIPDCAGTAGNEVIVELVSDFIQVHGTDVTSLVSAGDRIFFTLASGVVQPISKAVISTHFTAGEGTYVYMEDDGARYSSTSIAEPTAAADVTVGIYGVGTSESSPCSDRGVCNIESGDCECFAGYTGLACQVQNALSA